MDARPPEAAASEPGAGADEHPLSPFIIVEPFEETHGWPVADSGIELPGERLPVLRVVQMFFMPWKALCEWPLLLLGAVASRDRDSQR